MCASPQKVQCSSPNPGTNPTSSNPLSQTTNAATDFNSNPTESSGVTTGTLASSSGPSSANSTGSGCDLSKEFTPVPNTGCVRFYR